MLRLFFFFYQKGEIFVGRPKKDNRRDKVITIRITDDELKELETIAYKSGLNRSEIILEAIRMKINLMKFTLN